MDVSANSIIILSILIIILSVFGTYFLIEKIDNVSTSQNYQINNQGQVGVYVTKPSTGQVGVEVIDNEE